MREVRDKGAIDGVVRRTCSTTRSASFAARKTMLLQGYLHVIDILDGRAALDMHEFMLQCYYQIRGRNAERLQVDKAMLTSTPLGGIARLSPRHVISR